MFSNLSHAQNVSSTLLSQFGKSTKVLLEVHGHKVTVRRCWDNRTIATVYCMSPDSIAVYVPTVEEGWLFKGMEISNGGLSQFIMSRNTWPRAGKNDRSWSIPSYKDAGDYVGQVAY